MNVTPGPSPGISNYWTTRPEPNSQPRSIYTENFFRVKWLKNWVMLSQFWPIYVESFWLIFGKTSPFDPEKMSQIDSNLTMTQLLSRVDSKSQFISPSHKTESDRLKINHDSVWLGNWVTRNNANIFESTWLNTWVMVEFESIWLRFSGSNWLVFSKNESKWLDVYGSKLEQYDSIFESLWPGKNSQCIH